jgi:hypothetical protein
MGEINKVLEGVARQTQIITSWKLGYYKSREFNT